MGAHAMSHKSESYKDVWKVYITFSIIEFLFFTLTNNILHIFVQTANMYHMLHSCILGTVAYSTTSKKRLICGTLFLSGIILFSG